MSDSVLYAIQTIRGALSHPEYLDAETLRLLSEYLDALADMLESEE